MGGGARAAANEVDEQIGRRIRECRRSIGMRQDTLAAALGLTFQQVQKYERGFNRVSASRLYEIARILNVPICDLFVGLPPTTGLAAEASTLAHQPELARMMGSPGGAAVAEFFPKIESAGVRRAVADLVRAMVLARASS